MKGVAADDVDDDVADRGRLGEAGAMASCEPVDEDHVVGAELIWNETIGLGRLVEQLTATMMVPRPFGRTWMVVVIRCRWGRTRGRGTVLPSRRSSCSSSAKRAVR